MEKRIKAYLAAPIFTERDRNFNSYLEQEILKLCPNLDLYLAQNNSSINDKTGCATSADIYVGDIRRLKESDLLITIMSGDLPPIGSSYEVAYFCGLCEQNPTKRIIALYDDSREATSTYSESKKNAMISGIAENQFPYINLLAVGFVKKWGTICHNSKELIQEVKRQYDLGFDLSVCGIYKITNLKNNLVYIGQSIDVYTRLRSHKNCTPKTEIDIDIQKLGTEYFKFELLEVCPKEKLNERENYWINYYDSYENGYNNTDGENRNSQSIQVSCYDDDGNLINTFNSLTEAARYYNYSSYWNISSAIRETRNKVCDLRWRRGCNPQIEPYVKIIPGKGTVYAYDKNTRLFVEQYDNAACAQKKLNISHSHISQVLNNKRKSAGGFIWAYDKYDRLPETYFKEKENEF